MSASTALQTSLTHTFSEEIFKHISHYRVSFNFQIIDAGIDNFSNPFWWNFMKIPSCNQSNSDENKYMYVFLGKPGLLNFRVTAAT